MKSNIKHKRKKKKKSAIMDNQDEIPIYRLYIAFEHLVKHENVFWKCVEILRTFAYTYKWRRWKKKKNRKRMERNVMFMYTFRCVEKYVSNLFACCLILSLARRRGEEIWQHGARPRSGRRIRPLEVATAASASRTITAFSILQKHGLIF